MLAVELGIPPRELVDNIEPEMLEAMLYYIDERERARRSEEMGRRLRGGS